MVELKSFGEKLNIALIGSSGGIGSALIHQLCACKNVDTIHAFSRTDPHFNDDKVNHAHIDLTCEKSIKAAAQSISAKLDLIIVSSGILHDADLEPEKAIRDLNMEVLQKVFAVNCFGPALIAKYFLPLLRSDQKAIFAAISARVGSITDNQLGGWYSYRASKASLNMLLKTAAIEIARKRNQISIVGLHPGTVDTELSKPFQGNVKHDIFTAEQSAVYLLNVLDNITIEDSGKVFAWNGQEIPP